MHVKGRSSPILNKQLNDTIPSPSFLHVSPYGGDGLRDFKDIQGDNLLPRNSE